ncbi:CUE domain-containing protein 1 isoform X2 [Brevipalpus obovatus]|uniref:CUE domain-containing protein 1 isoform X2 n=1 Tax=Brevipalpus obovatus TaxID=246614 RepID=UPI003D9F0198
MATLDQIGSVDDRRNQTNLPVTQLDFSQAMQDFKTMFPTLEESVIEMVLRSNNGAVDVTIDQLLTMTSDNEQDSKSNLLGHAPPPGFRERSVNPTIIKGNSIQLPLRFPPEYSQGALSEMKDPREKITNTLKGKSKWNPPLIGPLPDNFLRITPSGFGGFSPVDLKKRMEENERQRRLTKDVEDLEAAQYLEDERMAIFLQNEEFIRELRHNKDFMKTLDMDAAFQTRLDDVLPDGPSVPSHEDDAAFKEKLKHMGKTSRKKFAHFAKIFSRRRRTSFPQLLGRNSHETAGRENLFGDDSYSQLNNESDNENVSRKKGF